jgi:hypothetical protein
LVYGDIILELLLIRAVRCSDDPILRYDRAAAEVESTADKLQGHLPGDLTRSSLDAADDLAVSLEELLSTAIVDTA